MASPSLERQSMQDMQVARPSVSTQYGGREDRSTEGTRQMGRRRSLRSRDRRSEGSTYKRSLAESAARTGIAYAAGGTSKALDRATRSLTGVHIDRISAKHALRFRNQRRNGTDKLGASSEKKMTGTGFYLVVGIAVAKDIADIIGDLTVVFSVVSVLTTLVVAYIVGFYLFYIGVKPSTRKVVAWIISLVIDLIPFASVLPTYSASLFLIRWLENNEHGSMLPAFLKRGKGK